MKDNFDACLSHTLRWEGGYSDHPADPGGKTYRGVTQATYDAWRRTNGHASRPVTQMSDEEMRAIYRSQYWDAVRADDLPRGVDLATFDYAVNSGPARAARDLQAVLGVTRDGVVGNLTLAAMQGQSASTVSSTLCDRRLKFVRGLSGYSTFGRGWERRIADIRAQSQAMAMGSATRDDIATEPTSKADPKDRTNTSLLGEALKDPVAAIPVAGGMLSALGDEWGPISIAIGFAIVAGTLWLLVRAMRRQTA